MAVAHRVAHPFEVRGLGTAPFTCFGSYESKYQAAPDAPVQPGTCCDYCGTGIMYVFAVRSADGKEFKVGSDCVLKTHQEIDTALPIDFRLAIEEMNRKRREAIRKRRWVRERIKREAVAHLLSQHPALFTDQEHPNAYYASQGRTMREYYEWHLDRHNAAMVKRIESAINAELARCSGGV